MYYSLIVVVLHVERQSVFAYYGFEEDGDGSGHVQSQWFQYSHGLVFEFGVEAHGRGRRVRHALLLPFLLATLCIQSIS